MSLRYTEHGASIKFDTITGFIKSSAVLLVTAPYRLIIEISLKLPFLKKGLVECIMIGAVAVGAVVIVLTAAIQMFFDSFTITGGKMPLLAMCIGLGILIAGCVAFNSMTDVFYSRRSCIDVSASTKSFDSRTAEAVEVKKAAEHTTEAVVSATAGSTGKKVSIQEELQIGHPQQGQAVQKQNEQNAIYQEDTPAQTEQETELNTHINAELYENQDIIAYHRRRESGIEAASANAKADKAFDRGDLEELIEAMDTSTDPSKFIPEDIIAHFAKESKEENDIDFIAELNLGVVPSDFTALT